MEREKDPGATPATSRIALRNMRQVKRPSLSQSEAHTWITECEEYYFSSNLMRETVLDTGITGEELVIPNAFCWSRLQEEEVATHPVQSGINYNHLADEEYTDIRRVMQQYSDDIEMWDFDQILDNSPLTALTADFARFKRRFTNIFSNSSDAGVPYIDSDSSDSVCTVAAATNRPGSTSSLAQDSNKATIKGTNCNGSSHYTPKRSTSHSQETVHDHTRHYSSQVKGRADKPLHTSDHSSISKHKSFNTSTKSQPETASGKSSLGSTSTPAKRPTDLPVVPHIITEEYVSKMRTKGYRNTLHSDSDTVHLQPAQQGSQPRLTRSYLEEYHNRGGCTGYPHSTHSVVQDWQLNKYKEEVQDNINYNNSLTRAKEKNHRRNGAVRFNDAPSLIDPDAEDFYMSAFKREDGPKAFLSQDNRFIKEDSWRGPPTPYPHKTDTTVGATHRGTHRFTPRHSDELQIEIGDSIHVLDEADDGWCMGINLTSQSQGIFPSVYATDLEFYEINENTTVKQPQPKLYKLHFLGSLEVNQHKGSKVLVDAIEKIILNRRISKDSTTPPLCQLEVSEAGIKMIDLTHKKRTHKLVTDMNIDSACERLSKLLAFSKETKAVSNHFFSLKNVSFCGYHPENPRYFGFITKHPTQRRFACHCYSSIDQSTQPIVDAVGEAFNNYYCGFDRFGSSSEEIYLE